MIRPCNRFLTAGDMLDIENRSVIWAREHLQIKGQYIERDHGSTYEWLVNRVGLWETSKPNGEIILLKYYIR